MIITCAVCEQRPAELRYTDASGNPFGFCLECAALDNTFAERLAQACVGGMFAQGMLLARLSGQEAYLAHWRQSR